MKARLILAALPLPLPHIGLSDPAGEPPQKGPPVYVFTYHVPQHLLDEMMTEEEAVRYHRQDRLRPLLERIGIEFLPGASRGWSGAPVHGYPVRHTVATHRLMRAYLNHEFGRNWKIVRTNRR